MAIGPGQTPQSPGTRILVWGVTGAGKTTASRAIGQALGLPVLELDAIYWQQDWQVPEPSDFIGQVTRLLADCPAGWVCDGNYGSLVKEMVLAQGDTVVWLDLPFRVTFPRVLRRTAVALVRREVLWGKCPQTFRQAWWLVRFAASQPPLARAKAETNLALLRAHSRVQLYRLRSVGEVSAFLKGLTPADLSAIGQ